MSFFLKIIVYDRFLSLLLEGKAWFMRKVLHKPVGVDVLCQEQDCKQLCKRIVYTFNVQSLRFWKLNGA